MKISRKKFLKTVTAIGSAIAMKSRIFGAIQTAMDNGAEFPPVVWLQGQGCTGCSVSLLNSITCSSIDNLLLNTISMEYHPNLSAAAGELAADGIEAAFARGNYILVIEGAVPAGEAGDYCHIWDGMTILQAVQTYAPAAAAILAVGTCAAYGGIPGSAPDPTSALSVQETLSLYNINNALINLPGCPAHPDWVVGTIAGLLDGIFPSLDSYKRPRQFYKKTVHSSCPNRGLPRAGRLGEAGCLLNLGCKGQWTYADCPSRKWNSDLGDAAGVNWCIGAKFPCQGCTEPDFPDGKLPFFLP